MLRGSPRAFAHGLRTAGYLPLSATALSCPHRPPCPGCPRFGDDRLAPGPLRQLEALAASHSCSFTVETGPGLGYRHRTRLSVRPARSGPGIGIFEAGSHRLVSIPQCPVHHPTLVHLAEGMRAVLLDSSIAPYDEATHSGLVRAVQIAVPRIAQRAQVVVVVNDDLADPATLSARLRPLLDWLGAEPLVQGVFVNGQPLPTNTLLGPRFHHVSGQPVLEDQAGGASVFYPPGAFGQGNPVMHERALREIHASVTPGRAVFEYYAGVGTIGLGLVARGHSVMFNELGPGSLEGLRRGLAAIGSPASARIVPGRAGDHAGAYASDSVVIVDPPRKGLDASLLDRLCREPPAQLIYLSCGLPALLREIESLTSGGLELRKLGAWGYFPYTEHVETLAIFG